MPEQNLLPDWTEEQRELAVQSANASHATEPRITHADFDAATGVVTLDLAGGAVNGARLSFPARALLGLESASDMQLNAFIVAGQGASIRWPEANVGIGTPALVRWMTGQRDETTHRQMANLARMRAETGALVAPESVAA